MPAPRRDVDRVPRLPVVAHAVDLGPSRSRHHEEDRVPRVPVDRRDRAGIDFVHQGVEAARRAVAVPAHVDAAAHPPRGGDELHILLADYALAMLAPVLDEFRAALLLALLMRLLGLGLGAHGSRIWNSVPLILPRLIRQ